MQSFANFSLLLPLPSPRFRPRIHSAFPKSLLYSVSRISIGPAFYFSLYVRLMPEKNLKFARRKLIYSLFYFLILFFNFIFLFFFEFFAFGVLAIKVIELICLYFLFLFFNLTKNLNAFSLLNFYLFCSFQTLIVK